MNINCNLFCRYQGEGICVLTDVKEAADLSSVGSWPDEGFSACPYFLPKDVV